MKSSIFLILLFLFASLKGNAQEWIQQISNTSSDLSSVYFVNKKLGFAVGTNGVILKTNDGLLNLQVLITTFFLFVSLILSLVLQLAPMNCLRR